MVQWLTRAKEAALMCYNPVVATRVQAMGTARLNRRVHEQQLQSQLSPESKHDRRPVPRQGGAGTLQLTTQHCRVQ